MKESIQVRLVPLAEQVEGKGPMGKVSEVSSEVLEYAPAQLKGKTSPCPSFESREAMFSASVA
ncbi:MAG: hypothetical protein GY811_07655 [Myxococcales bacterium]|nr:hypothetical protein [Myxococcales bacterium]